VHWFPFHHRRRVRPRGPGHPSSSRPAQAPQPRPGKARLLFGRAEQLAFHFVQGKCRRRSRPRVKAVAKISGPGSDT